MEILIPESPVCYKKTDGCPTPILQKLDGLWYIAQLVGTADFDAEYYVSSQGEFGSLIDKINKIDGIVTMGTSLIVGYIKYAGANMPEPWHFREKCFQFNSVQMPGQQAAINNSIGYRLCYVCTNSADLIPLRCRSSRTLSSQSGSISGTEESKSSVYAW